PEVAEVADAAGEFIGDGIEDGSGDGREKGHFFQVGKRDEVHSGKYRLVAELDGAAHDFALQVNIHDVARAVRGNRFRPKAKLLDFDVQPGFFSELADGTLMKGLSIFEATAGQHPVKPVALAMAHQEDFIVFRNHHYGNASGGYGRAGSAFVSMSDQRLCAL